MMNDFEKYMRIALEEACKAQEIDEVPVGAIIVRDGKIIAKAHNTKENTQISTHHAEILCIEIACRELGSWRLEGCELYVTLEPCSMCAGAIIQSRVEKVVFGARDPKGGFFGGVSNINDVKGLNHYPEVISGILEDESSNMLKNFFKQRR